MKLRLAQAGRVLLNLSELHARRAENATDNGPFTEAQRTHRAQTNSKWSYSLISLYVNHLIWSSVASFDRINDICYWCHVFCHVFWCITTSQAQYHDFLRCAECCEEAASLSNGALGRRGRHPANPAIWKSGSPMKKSIVLWKNWEKWGKSHENYMFSGGKIVWLKSSNVTTVAFSPTKKVMDNLFWDNQKWWLESFWYPWPPNRQQRLNMKYMNQYTCSDRKGTIFTWFHKNPGGFSGYHWIPLDTIGYPMKIMKASSLCTSQHVDWFIVSPGLNHRALGGWGRVGAFAHLRLAVHLSVRVPTQMTLGSRPSGHIAWHVFADWIGWIVIESWILDGTWSDMMGHDGTFDFTYFTYFTYFTNHFTNTSTDLLENSPGDSLWRSWQIDT